MTSKTSRSEVIRVCFPFIGNNVGGSHISTLMLTKNLDRRQIEPTIVLHEEGDLAEFLRRDGQAYEMVPIREFQQPPFYKPRNLAQLLVQIPRLVVFLRRRRIDVVHMNDARIHYGWSLAAKLAGAILIWHQRQGAFGKSKFKLMLASMADRIVCISKYTVAMLPDRLKSQTAIVANPFDTSFATINRQEAKATVAAELCLPPTTKLVGFNGSLVARKRPDVFLRAAARIKSGANVPVAFLLLGKALDGADEELRRLAMELDIADAVHILGFRHHIESWIAGCDLMMATAVREGLGRNLIEAMIVGTPVIATDAGGHREVICDGVTGFLAPVDDTEYLARIACQILNDPLLAARIADRAQGHATKTYSIEPHVRSITTIYKEAWCSAGSKSKCAAPS